MLRIICLPCASVVIVLDGGLDAYGPADAENSLIIHMDMFIMPQIIVDAPVTLIRTLHVDLFDLFRYLFILYRSGALCPGCPPMVGGSRNMQQSA